MEPTHPRSTKPPSSGQKATLHAASYPELLMDGDYVARLRPSVRTELDGLVIGDPEAFGVSLGFEKGDWILSKAAQVTLSRDEVWVAFLNHSSGDWGNVDEQTAEANFLALQHGGALRSAYYTSGGIRFTITTNAERTRTTVQLEQEPPM